MNRREFLKASPILLPALVPLALPVPVAPLVVPKAFIGMIAIGGRAMCLIEESGNVTWTGSAESLGMQQVIRRIEKRDALAIARNHARRKELGLTWEEET